MLRGLFGNLIFAIIARMLCGNYLKTSLHQLLLCILKLEDTYVDTPTLVNKLSKMI